MLKEDKYFLMENLDQTDKKIYAKNVESIIDGIANIHFLLQYLYLNSDNGVSEGIRNYILQKNKNYDFNVIIKLSDFHETYKDKILRDFYEAYNDFLDEKDFINNYKNKAMPKSSQNLIKKIENLDRKCYEVENLIMNYCAMNYLRKNFRSKIDLNYQNEHNITPDLTSFFEKNKLSLEFTCVDYKLGKLGFQFKNLEYPENEKIHSLYDMNWVAEEVTIFALNEISLKAIKILNNNSDYSNLSLIIYCIAYYCVLYKAIFNKTQYCNEKKLEKYFFKYFKLISKDLKEKCSTEDNVLESIINMYNNAICDISSECVSDKKTMLNAYNTFENNVGYIGKKTFYFWYAKICEYIKQDIKNKDFQNSF